MNTDLNFPSGNPLDAAGNLTPQWRMFFLTLFTRSGGTAGNDTSALQAAITAADAKITDLQTEGGAGSPVPDMAAVYAMIHVVEAIAVQAMAASTRQPDERGEAGEAGAFGALERRIAEIESQIHRAGADGALIRRVDDAEVAANAGHAPPVTSVATRQGDVTLAVADVSGAAPSANASFTGTFAIAPATTTTAPSAGSAGALPTAPAGYVTITIGGVARKIAYY